MKLLRAAALRPCFPPWFGAIATPRALSTDSFFISRNSKSPPVKVSRSTISLSRERVLSGIQPTGVPHIGAHPPPPSPPLPPSVSVFFIHSTQSRIHLTGCLQAITLEPLSNGPPSNATSRFASASLLRTTADQRFTLQNKDVLSRLYCIVDLHAITVKSCNALPPLEQRSFKCAAFLIACGLDSNRCTLFVQSHVPQHASLCWLLQCCTPLSWLHRMTQFKSKSESNSQGSAAASTALLTYPVLQAADILLYVRAPKNGFKLLRSHAHV